MYNEELKNRFLNNYSNETAKTYRDSLMQIDRSEEFYGKDVFSFNYEQLDNAFKTIRSKSLSGVRRITSPVTEYIKWANSEGYIKSKVDITELFKGDKLNDYVWKHAQENSYIYREEMYGLCEFLANDVDKAILVLAFEGIDGREHHELLNLKYTDINFATGHIKVVNINGVIREVVIEHKESLDILKASQEQVMYLMGNGDTNNSKIKQYELVNSPYVVRKIGRTRNMNNDEEITSIGFLMAKVTRFFKGKKNPLTGDYTEEPYLSDAEFLNLNNLHKSGYFDACLRLENNKGELNMNDYRTLCTRYGVNEQLAQRYKEQYLAWKSMSN